MNMKCFLIKETFLTITNLIFFKNSLQRIKMGRMKMKELTFSRRKFDTFPPIGSPPRLNWISTYFPYNKKFEYIKKEILNNYKL